MNDLTILCSGVALGVYIPALILYRKFKECNIKVELHVLENYLKAEKLKITQRSKIAFHKSFKVALTGQKLARDLSAHYDEELTKELIAGWQREKRDKFIAFSGYWVPLLNRYQEQTKGLTPDIQLCHLDAAHSTSFKPYSNHLHGFTQVWFFKRRQKSISFFIDIAAKRPQPFSSRKARFVIHGGGWGMGTYREKIPCLLAAGKALDIINYGPEDLTYGEGDLVRNYILDMHWNPWQKDKSGEHTFPPLSSVNKHTNRNYPLLYDLIASAYAIISKPGGATLLDSFASATPLVFCEPFGDHERQNGILWEELGFGISWQSWQQQNYDFTILERLHNNLIAARRQTKEYSSHYLTLFSDMPRQRIKYAKQ